MASPAPFTLCRIQRDERTYFYALFRNPETGKRTNKKSVETLRKQLGIYDTTPIRRRDEAIRICQKALEEGIVFRKQQEQLFGAYLAEFYTYEISPYVRRRNLLEPGSISKRLYRDQEKSDDESCDSSHQTKSVSFKSNIGNLGANTTFLGGEANNKP